MYTIMHFAVMVTAELTSLCRIFNIWQVHVEYLIAVVILLQVKKGPQKGQMQEVIKRKNSLTEIMKVSLR